MLNSLLDLKVVWVSLYITVRGAHPTTEHKLLTLHLPLNLRFVISFNQFTIKYHQWHTATT